MQVRGRRSGETEGADASRRAGTTIPTRGCGSRSETGGSRAAVAAGTGFRLLGARDLGVKEDYRVAQMPPVNTGLLDGELAWRQHDGGHEDRSNMKHFLAWANRFLRHAPPAPAVANPPIKGP